MYLSHMTICRMVPAVSCSKISTAAIDMPFRARLEKLHQVGKLESCLNLSFVVGMRMKVMTPAPPPEYSFTFKLRQIPQSHQKLGLQTDENSFLDHQSSDSSGQRRFVEYDSRTKLLDLPTVGCLSPASNDPMDRRNYRTNHD